MKLYTAKALLPLIFSLILISCNNKEKSVNLLQKAQSIVESNPSQAFILLDSIRSPEEMDTDNYMQYIMTRVQSKYKTNQDITTDTLIFTAQQYFDKGTNPDKKALANYYSAAVYDEKKILDKSLLCYMSAERYARQAGNYLLAGRSLHSIAHIYYGEGLMDSAIVRIGQAMECYNRAGGAELNKLQAINFLGVAYQDIKELDSAYLYLNKGLELAHNLNNSEYKSILISNLGLVLRDKGDYEKSINYFRQSIIPEMSRDDTLQLYLNLSTVYNLSNNLDSANYYTNLLKERLSEITDSYIPRSIYGALSDYNVKTGNYKEAHYYTQLQRDYDKKIAEADLANKLIQAENTYQLDLKEKELEAVQTRFYLLLIIGVLLVSMIICISYFKAKNMRLRNQQEKEKNRLLQIQYDQKANSLIFLQNIYRKISNEWMAIDKEVDMLAEEYGAKEKPTIYISIKELIENIRQISNNQLIEWAKDYLMNIPNGKSATSYLSDSELLLLGLYCYHFTKTDIANIMKISVNRIHPIKLAIKHKFKRAGLSDAQIDKILFSNINN
ncbi:tetratricopeptide repeat protein [Dysgonomonas sp. ZJ279]|uniref:tetratricopeptide repeat protein n=1 Tax=Dysgonomonas sp. ZJ279 TaxID=2709796 RepID=UPI0013EC5B73|nr:tetratricopeptide repeat protein [Dysgonomonas sp. ZJ279]